MTTGAAEPPANHGRRFLVLADGAGFVLLLATIAVAPLLYGALESTPRFVLRVGVLATFALILPAAIWRHRGLGVAAWVAAPLAGYVAWTWLAAAHSTYTYGSVQAALDASLPAAGFLMVAASARSIRRKKIVLGALVLGAGVTAAAGAAQLLDGGWLQSRPDERLSGIFANPNHFAGLLDIAAPLALGLALWARRTLASVSLFAAAACLYASLGLTYSYGGWLATGTATLFLVGAWIASSTRPRTALIRFAGAITLVACAGAAMVFLVDRSPRLRGATMERLQSFLQPSEFSTFQARRTIHAAGLALALEHPWLGVGPGNFDEAIVAFRPSEITDRAGQLLHRNVLHSLNDVLNVASQAGWPAAGAFVLFWLAIMIGAAGPPGVRWPTTAALLAILLHGLVDGNLSYVTGNAYLAFVAAGVLGSRSSRRGQFPPTAAHPTNEPSSGTNTTV